MAEDAPPWYKADIGPRLKPQIRDLYEKRTGLKGDELITHIHQIVRINNNVWHFLILLLMRRSETKHGRNNSIPVLGSGCSFYQASCTFQLTLKSCSEYGVIKLYLIWDAVLDKTCDF